MEHRTRSRSERLEARISPAQKEVLARAAALQGRTITDFVVTQAFSAALETIREHEMMSLSRRDQEAFAQALLAPAEPAEALRQAFAQHRNLLNRSDP